MSSEYLFSYHPSSVTLGSSLFYLLSWILYAPRICYSLNIQTLLYLDPSVTHWDDKRRAIWTEGKNLHSNQQRLYNFMLHIGFIVKFHYINASIFPLLVRSVSFSLPSSKKFSSSKNKPHGYKCPATWMTEGYERSHFYLS